MQDTQQVVWYSQNIGGKVSNDNWTKLMKYQNTCIWSQWSSCTPVYREGEYQFVDPMPKAMQQVNIFLSEAKS